MILGAQKIQNQLIRLLRLRPSIPAQNGRLDGNHKNPGFRQLRVHDLDEWLNVLCAGLRSFAARRSQSVVSGVYAPAGRTIGSDGPVSITLDAGVVVHAN